MKSWAPEKVSNNAHLCSGLSTRKNPPKSPSKGNLKYKKHLVNLHQALYESLICSRRQGLPNWSSNYFFLLSFVEWLNIRRFTVRHDRMWSSATWLAILIPQPCRMSSLGHGTILIRLTPSIPHAYVALLKSATMRHWWS